jgi:hypothetical protein
MKIAGGRRRILTFDDADSFIAMFPTSDFGGNLATIWEGGSAFHVRVWHYDGTRASLVLEEGSRFLPEFIDIDGDGTLEIVITKTSTANPNSQKTLRGTRIAYTWNAGLKRYDASKFDGSKPAPKAFQ